MASEINERYVGGLLLVLGILFECGGGGTGDDESPDAGEKEALLGLSEDASWHAKLKDSAYVSSAAATSSPYSRRELAPPHFVTLCLTVVVSGTGQGLRVCNDPNIKHRLLPPPITSLLAGWAARAAPPRRSSSPAVDARTTRNPPSTPLSLPLFEPSRRPPQTLALFPHCSAATIVAVELAAAAIPPLRPPRLESISPTSSPPPRRPSHPSNRHHHRRQRRHHRRHRCSPPPHADAPFPYKMDCSRRPLAPHAFPLAGISPEAAYFTGFGRRPWLAPARSLTCGPRASVAAVLVTPECETVEPEAEGEPEENIAVLGLFYPVDPHTGEE
nr:unnamed protein product [Digitaria exilis]